MGRARRRLERASGCAFVSAGALALGPAILVLEHPSATLARAEVAPLARESDALPNGGASRRSRLTHGREFARAVAPQDLDARSRDRPADGTAIR